MDVFISSTVEDLGPVREEIASRLRARGLTVHLSESPDFPVAPGVTSHEACLAIVRASQVFVLLVGRRFGGEYASQGKSITWREWEEAVRAGLLQVVLIEQHANHLSREIAAARKELLAAEPSLSIPAQDARLKQRWKDHKPLEQGLPGVQRFVDELRKGRVDNWVHFWSGTTDAALRFIDARLAATLADYHRQRDTPRREAIVRLEQLRTVSRLAQWGGLLTADVRSGRLSHQDAIGILLDVCVTERDKLFAFDEQDRYNLMVYRRRGSWLVPGERAHHPDIRPRGRRWRVGQGHVGLAVRERAVLVSGDLRQTATWQSSRRSDAHDRNHYVSAVSVPLVAGEDAAPDGVFILTSSRLDHFRNHDQVEVLIAETVGGILTGLLLGGDP